MLKSKILNAYRSIFIYFIFLFLFLLIIVWSNLSLPPLSDDWHLFYFIQHLNELPGSFKLLHVLNYDPFEQMRFQPVSRIFYYALHVLFGANFLFFKIFNISIYFLVSILFYRFSLFFIRKKSIVVVATFVFVFLANHFDIVLWAHHIYIIFGLFIFLLGFISYICFMSSRRRTFIYLSILCFLVGMWCYEPFFLWPLAIIILSSISRFQHKSMQKSYFGHAVPWIMLGIIYIIYAGFYLITRSFGTYLSPVYTSFDFLKLGNFMSSLFLTLFNFAYNGILVNILPFLAFPLKVNANIYMGGPVLTYISTGHKFVVYIGGAFVGLILISSYLYFYKKKYFEEIKIVIFFFFLMFSVMYPLFFFRLVTNDFVYGMTEFRYQYIQNTFVVLIIAFLIDRFVRFSLNMKVLLNVVVATVLIFNIYGDHKEVRINNEQLSDLKQMFSNINRGIKQGRINERSKLYLEEDTSDYLPSLCWNIEMGSRFMRGTYQWMFSAQEVRFFAETMDEASWVIDKDDFSVIAKEERHKPKKKKIFLGKEEQYLNLADYYQRNKKFKQAKAILQAALKINPDNISFYYRLRDLYFNSGLTVAAEIMDYKAQEVRNRQLIK